MHHDGSFSWICRRGRELFSFHNIRSLRPRVRPLQHRALPSFLPLALHVRHSSNIAAISTEAQPDEDAPAQTKDDPVTIEVRDATTSVPPDLPPRWTSGALTRSPKAFVVPLLDLPLNGQFLDHPGSYPALPWLFSSLFSRLFKSYCEKKTIDELRQEFAVEVDLADTIWKTYSQEILAHWIDHTLARKTRARDVAWLLVGSLLTSADRILDVLNVLKPLDKDFALRAHCLYLTGFLYKSALLQDKALLNQYDAEINKLRATKKWPEERMSLDHIRMLLWRSDEAQIKSLLSSLRQKYPNMNVWTLLYLTAFCGRTGLPDEAFSFFSTLSPCALQNPHSLVLACCSLLLQHDYVVHTDTGPNFRYLLPLLEKGLSPDSLLYHRIIERALASDYAGVAWDVYHHQQTLNLTIYWRTYHVLLRQAFNSRNVKGVDEIMSQIHERKDLYTNRTLLMYAMNMVRRVNHTSGRMNASHGLAHMLALYDRVYTRAPLEVFGITSSSEHITFGSGSITPGIDLAAPSSYVVSFTVWAFILCHKHGKSVQWLWKKIETLVEEGNKTVLQCLRRDLIYNAFIWLHLKHNETIPDALEVFQYMLEKQFCLPTARTWSIMICGLLRLGQRAQAQHVYNLMCAHGFAIDNICREYVDSEISLDELERRADQVLDEHMMPDGTEGVRVREIQHLQSSQAQLLELAFGSDVAPSETLYDLGSLDQLDDSSSVPVPAQ